MSEGRIYHRGDALWISWYANGDRREAVSTIAGKRPGETTWDDAVAVLRERCFEKEVARRQRSILPEKITTPTVVELLGLYERHRLIQGVKHPVDFKGTMRVLGEWWGHLNLARLTTAGLEREIQVKLDAGLKRGSVAQRLSGLYAALRWGLEEKRLGQVPRKPKIRVPATPTVLWREGEVDSLCAATKPWVADIIRVGQLTGWRISEILGLVWDRVDLKRGILYLDDTKSDDPRHRPIEGRLSEILARRQSARRLGNPLVFHVDGLPVTDDRFHRNFAGAVARADLGRRRFHAFRHTAYDTLFNAGVDPYTAQELVGHKSFSSTRRYKKQDLTLMRRALALVEAARPDSSGTADTPVVSITR